jgi:hypothetical protein
MQVANDQIKLADSSQLSDQQLVIQTVENIRSNWRKQSPEITRRKIHKKDYKCIERTDVKKSGHNSVSGEFMKKCEFDLKENKNEKKAAHRTRMENANQSSKRESVSADKLLLPGEIR